MRARPTGFPWQQQISGGTTYRPRPRLGAAPGLSIVPAGIGNMVGGAFLVAPPFWYALRPEARATFTDAA